MSDPIGHLPRLLDFPSADIQAMARTFIRARQRGC